jgi:hypothetical protein
MIKQATDESEEYDNHGCKVREDEKRRKGDGLLTDGMNSKTVGPSRVYRGQYRLIAHSIRYADRIPMTCTETQDK